MSNSPPRSRIPTGWAGRLLATAILLPYGWLHIGFMAHRSRNVQILDLYSWKYAAFLIGLAIPYWLIVRWSRFLTTPSLYQQRDGQTIAISPGRKVAYCAFIVLICLSFAELLYRFIEPIEMSPQARTQHFIKHAFLQSALRPKGEYDNGSVSYTINDRGFRGPDLQIPKPPGEFRIFTLGGSSVTQIDPDDGRDWPGMVADRIGANGERTAIVIENAATSGHTSLHSLIKYLTSIRPCSPDLVVIYHGVNDLCRGFEPEAFSTGPYRGDYGHFFFTLNPKSKPDLIEIDWQRLRVLDRLRDEARSLFRSSWFTEAPSLRGVPVYQEYVPTEFRSVAAFARNMEDIVRAVLDDGAQVLLATQPTLVKESMSEQEIQSLWMHTTFCRMDAEGLVLSAEGYCRGMMAFNDTIRRLATELPVVFCDLDRIVPKDRDHFHDGVHATGKGLRVIADALAQSMLDHGLLPAE